MLASPPCFWTPVPLADPGPSAGGAGAGEGDDEELEDEEVDGGVVDVNVLAESQKDAGVPPMQWIGIDSPAPA